MCGSTGPGNGSACPPAEGEPEQGTSCSASCCHNQVDRGYVIATYRYARVAIVVVIFALLASLGLEHAHATCWNDSISAYYYTPVHSIFVATLFVLGVSLFTIRGGDFYEEALLNMAGFLAPVVAFVPTAWSTADCPSNLTAAEKGKINNYFNTHPRFFGQFTAFFAKWTGNNLVAFIIAGFAAVLLISSVTAFRRKRARSGAKQYRADMLEVLLPAFATSLLIVGGYIWHEESPKSFSTHAHAVAAIVMFVLVGIVMLLTANRNRATGHTLYTVTYYVCPAVMSIGGVSIFIVGLGVSWHHELLILEMVELIPFVVFWFMQTIQLWDDHQSYRIRSRGPGRKWTITTTP